MSSEPPPGSGQQPPEDDPFRKQPPPGAPGPGSGPPSDAPHGSRPPPYQGGPYGGDPHGGGPGGGGPGGGDPYGGGGPYGGGPGGPGGPYASDPLAGMPPLADSGKRTLARIIDMIMVGIVVWLLTWAFNVREYEVDSDKFEVGRSFAQSLVAAVLYIAYDTILISRSGQTLGKKWLGMRVANLDNGATPSVQNTLVRSAVLWIPFAFCCACIWTAIAGGWSFFDKPYKQGLHDKAGKTVVVRTG
ncbi:RDD family protein [Streptomyces sp. NPDC087903]|uniref:RDD family protein n=1 Tax=Streptomyces sp. NPDC087903 TaxID=3365819 RepID=UPI0037F20D3D